MFHTAIKLIERNPRPWGGFLFTIFPHQELCVRGTTSKNLVQILRGGSSSIAALTHGSWWGNIVNRKPPWGGGVLKSALGFSVSVSETCFGNIAKQVLFPYVSISVGCFRKDPPPSLIPSFLDSKKQESRQKKNTNSCFHGFPRATMEDDNVHSVHEATLIVEQHPCLLQLHHSFWQHDAEGREYIGGWFIPKDKA